MTLLKVEYSEVADTVYFFLQNDSEITDTVHYFLQNDFVEGRYSEELHTGMAIVMTLVSNSANGLNHQLASQHGIGTTESFFLSFIVVISLNK